MKIGIIGAGATGLSAAFDLSDKGHHVKVYERDNFIGGHASTFLVGTRRLERGYHHWFTSDIDILRLMKDIGLENRVMWLPSKVGTLYDGKLYDFVTPLDILKFRPLCFTDRIRLGLSALKIRKIPNWEEVEAITAVDWLQENLENSVYESFWEPMLRGKFGDEHYKDIGMAWLWGKMNTRFTSRNSWMSKEMLGYPSESFGEIFDVLGKRIVDNGGEIHLSTNIAKIIQSEGKLRGLIIEGESPPKFEEFDAVIASIPSHVFSRITDGLNSDYMDQLGSVRYMSAILMILVLQKQLSEMYWLNVADRTIPFVGVIEHTNLIGPDHYGGDHIVYLSNYLTKKNPLYAMEEEELLTNYKPHLKTINSNFDESWIKEMHYHKIDYAQPIIGTNYSRNLPSHYTGIKNLYLANTTQIYPEDRGTNYSVKMGRHVANMVLENLCAP